ncbi:MAG: TIGR03032 family protein [Oscillatoriaceae cyanobacterium Prado104]|jgi:hypothetical protein|nr:TIGR03032 family protein [Oscillatoriaceae cyanobacterium Prado104]
MVNGKIMTVNLVFEASEIVSDRAFPTWLAQQKISLACTTYQN